MVLFTVASVNAGDVSKDIVASVDASDVSKDIVASVDADDVSDDVVVASDDTQNENISVSDNENILTDQPTTLTQLQNGLNSAGPTYELSSDYSYNSETDSALIDGIKITKSITINGNGHKVDGGGKMRIFQVTNGATVTFNNMTFVNGWTPKYGCGGAIWNNGAKKVTAINCNFTKNTAYNGGALFNVTAEKCTFVNNIAANEGGAIHSGSAVNCSFANNNAGYYGGAIYGGSAQNCSFINNRATRGGAIYYINSADSIVGCSFVNGSANFGGAILFMYKGAVINSSFINQRANFDGGAIYFETEGDAVPDCFAQNCFFSYNAAIREGGANYKIYSRNCTFINNGADKGGANYMGFAQNCTFINNKANYGAAMQYGSAQNCSFINNSATGYGGAMHSVSAVNCSFINNTGYSGGAMRDGSAQNCSFINNKAYEGGAMCGGSAQNCSFVNNKVDKIGSAMYQGSAKNCSFVNNDAIQTKIEFYNVNDVAYTGESILFTGLPECRIIVTATDKNGNSKTFTCTDKGWQVKDLDVGKYAVKFTISYDGIYGELITQIEVKFKPIQNLETLIKNTQNDTIILNNDYYCSNKGNLEDGIIIDKSVTIDGQGYRINANNQMRIFQVTNNAVVTFKNIIFENGYTATNGFGGAVWNNGAKNVTAINCTFKSNSAYNGGAISNVAAENCTFEKNTATYGGAMYQGSAENCKFVNNAASEYGGAIRHGYAFNCSFVNNTAKYGGAMANGSAVTCSFVNNAATARKVSGAIEEGSAVNCSFVNNNVYNTNIQFYNNVNDVVFPGDTVLFYGLPECNLTVTARDKNGVEKTFTCTDKGWKIEGLNLGNYTVKFSTYYEYNKAELESKIQLGYFLDLDVNIDSIFEGQNATVKINANDNFTDNVTLSVNGKDHTVEVINGVGNCSISGLPTGNHTATVSFKGSNKFNATEKTVKFEVKPKYNIGLNVNVEDINEGNMATVNITFDVEFDGTVKISISGTDIQNETFSIIEGEGSFIAMDLAAGNYNVTVSFDGNVSFNAETKSAEFKVKKEAEKPDLDLTVSVEDIFAGQNATVKVKTNNAFNGKLTLIINGIVNDNININNGEGSYTVENLPIGNYTAYVGFNGDNTFDSAAKAGSFEVKPKNDLDLNINVSDIFEGQDAVVNITSNNTFTGNVTLSVNGTDYTVKVINGVGNYTISGLPAGNHTATVSIKGNDKFSPTEKTAKFEVKAKYNLNLNVNASDIFEGQDAVVNITTDNNFTGEVILSINSRNITVNVVKGVGNYAIQDLSADNYTATVSFKGNYKFNPTQKSVKFEVKPKYNIGLNVNVEDINEGNMATVTVTTNDAFDGTVKISINGTEIQNETIEIIEGKGSFIAMDLRAENYTVTVRFDGTTEFNAETKSTEFKVKKEADKTDLNLTISVEDIYVGQYACVNVTTDDSFIGDLIIVINSIVNDNVFVLFGEGEYYIEDLPVGNYVAYIGFNGDETFESTAKSVAFEVKPKQDPNLVVSVEDIYEGQNATVKITADKEFTGNVSIFINWENVLVSVINGAGSHIISGLSIGNYTADVNFDGNYKFNFTEKSVEFEVKPKAEPPAIDVNVPADAETPEFTIKLPSDATGTLTVTVNGKTYTANLVNGSATITVPGLADGTYNAVISYSGDAKYPAVTKNSTLTVKNPVYKIINNKDVAMLYTSKSPYKVLVTKNGKAVGAGEAVAIKFNGKTYTVKTDKNGYATLKLPNVKPKKAKYVITATYKGITVKNTVKVNSIIKAANKKVKKSKKVTKVKITLKKVNGKYLKSKTLKIKFKGKTYKAKTNKKGKAKWKVKKSMLKKLKVGKKYKYKVTYGKDVVTKKLTIKK